MLTIENTGQRNVIEVDQDSAETMGGSVVLTGDDNHLVIGPGCRSHDGLRLELGSNSSIRLDGRTTLGNLFVHAPQDGHLHVGLDSGFNGAVRILMHEPGRVEIGNGSLFAGEIDITVSDMHSIIDATTEKRINPPADIAIGNRVWVGQRSMVLKGSQIGDGTVVGAMSLVRGPLPGNSICAGTPARVVRSGVTWRFNLLPWEPAVVADEPPAEPGAAHPVDADAEDVPPPTWLRRTARGALNRLRAAGRAFRGDPKPMPRPDR